jgi:Flp pilus assembly protein TadD
LNLSFVLVVFVEQAALAHVNLGAMLHTNGKLTEAELSYLTALRLQPNDNVTRENLVKLRNLMKQSSE